MGDRACWEPCPGGVVQEMLVTLSGGGQALCPGGQVGRGPAPRSGPEDSELKLSLTN